MRVIRFLCDGGLFYTVGLAVKCAYQRIRGWLPDQRLKVRRAGKAKSNCIWRPASSK